jgi:hypothetical protein
LISNQDVNKYFVKFVLNELVLIQDLLLVEYVYQVKLILFELFHYQLKHKLEQILQVLVQL